VESKERFFDKIWSLHRPNGEVRSRVVRLGRLSKIEGYHHVNETSWEIDSQQLIFRGADGSVTARAGETITNPDGLRSIIMMREDNISVQAHLLIERGDFTDLLFDLSEA
jgi:hypothetical protein